MKRKAILIGNSKGLSGVQKDLLDFKSFLLSNKGGAWYENEIILIEHSDLNSLRNAIARIKLYSPDYAIVFFSGHGAYTRNTILELSDGSVINESEVFGLAPKQISIFDCCRNKIERFSVNSASMDSIDLSESFKTHIRMVYENRIQQAIPQHIRLYSCSINESSIDTNNGGVYIQNLLKTAKDYTTYSNEKSVSNCHQMAKLLTESYTHGKQRPEAILPKCLSSQELILSINC